MKKYIIPITIVAALALIGYFLMTNQTESDVASEVQEEEVTTQQGEQTAAPQEDSLTGTWVSVDDDKYKLTITGDNTYEEIYDGEVVDTGSWETLTSLEGEGLEIEPGFDSDLYLKKSSSDGEDFYYNIAVANESELVITYLFGDVLRFTRVSE